MEELSIAAKEKNLEKVKEIYAVGEAPKYTGSALANACCYGGPEIVKFLLENGASFSYEGFPRGIWSGGEVIRMKDLNAPGCTYWFDVFAVPAKKRNRTDETCTLTGEERAEVLRLLAQYKCTYGFPQLLYRAIRVADRPVAETLIELGYAALPDWVPEQLSGLYGKLANLPGTERNYWRVIQGWIADAGNEQLAWMIKTFVRCDRLEKFAFRKGTLYRDGKYIDRFSSPELFSTCLALTNLSEVAVKRDILHALVRENNAEGLSQVLELGWVRKYTDFDDLVEEGRSMGDRAAEVMAVLLEYEKTLKRPKALTVNQDPLAASVVRKSWRMKETKTTATLLAYKGKDLDVIIPARAGSRRVRAIEPGAFDPLVWGLRSDAAEIRRNLHSVVFPGSIKNIPSKLFHDEASIMVDVNSPFLARACPVKLEEIVLEKGVQVIEDDAFAVLPGLAEIEIPSSVREIGNDAFAYCVSLRDVQLPPGLQFLGARAFSYSGIKRITVPDMDDHAIFQATFFHAVDLEECILADGLEWIDDYAFRSCEKLRKIKLPANLVEIGHQAFQRCSSLSEIELPEGMTAIRNGAFSESGLSRIIIPESVESVGAHAFRDCRDLREIVFRNPHTTIGPYAFAGCEELVRVSGIELNAIGDGTFMGCRNLAGFHWDRKLKSIGAWAFFDSGLCSAILPAQVKSVGDGAFGECTSLSKIRIRPGTVIGAGAFAGCPGLEDEEGRIIVGGIMYGGMQDISNIMQETDSIYRFSEAEPVRRSSLRASVPVRATRMPSGTILDGMYPEQDIVAAEGSRPKVPLPSREILTSEDTVQFGAFPQTLDFVMQPIDWDIVRVDEEKVLLLSRKEVMFVDAFRFGTDDDEKPVTRWEDSRIRRILNDGFVPVAFSEEERRCIVPVKDSRSGEEDYAFLLSADQVMKDLQPSQRKTGLTNFAAGQVPGAMVVT